MPINAEERTALELAVASFEYADSVAVARLLYETLITARSSPTNPGGLAPDQVMALGRLIHDKAEWPTIAKVEEATGKRPIRFPLMKAVETVFRANLANNLPKLPEEHRQSVGNVLAKMDPDELKLLTVLLYDTLLEAPILASDPKKTGELHPLAKWLLPGWTWEQLKTMEPVVKSICVPLVEVCHSYFREHFPTIFRPVEEAKVEDAPPPPTPQQEAAQPTPPAPPIVESEIKVDEEEAAASDEEGAVSDGDPFAETSPQESSAVEAQTQEEDTTPVIPNDTPQESPPATPSVQFPAIATITGGNVVVTSQPSPPADDQHQTGQSPTPGNGHLSKKERKELRRKQREEAGGGT